MPNNFQEKYDREGYQDTVRGAAAGAGLGWMFGPVGALAGAGIGLLSRRMRKNELDKAVADVNSANEIDRSMTQALDQVMQFAAPGTFDQQQLQTIATRQDALYELAQHENPQMREYALRQMADLDRDIQAQLEDMESRAEGMYDSATRRQQELQDASIVAGTAREREIFGREMDLAQDLRSKIVEPYLVTETQYQKSIELLKSPDRLGYDFAFTMAIQALDGSVVREGERLAYVGSNGLVTSAVDTYNRWKGERTPEAEKALKNAIESLHRANKTIYDEAVGTYKRQAESFGLNWDRVSSVLPARNQAPPSFTPPSEEEATSDASRYGEDGLLDTMMFATAAGKTAWEAVPDAAKELGGTALAVAVGTGTLTASRALGLLSSFSKTFGAGMILNLMVSLAMSNADDVDKLLKPREGESDSDYQLRVAKEIMGRSGGWIDPNQIKVPSRPTND